MQQQMSRRLSKPTCYWRFALNVAGTSTHSAGTFYVITRGTLTDKKADFISFIFYLAPENNLILLQKGGRYFLLFFLSLRSINYDQRINKHIIIISN